MTTKPKPVQLLAVLAVAGAVGATAMTSRVHADERCRHVHGHFQSTFTTANCTSPIGLCTAGKITGGGFLDSSDTFLAFDAAPSAGLPSVEPAANVSYSGQLTINARLGTLVTKDLGVIDGVHNAFTELERPTSGSGIFTNASNVFFISGALVNNGNGFDGELSGRLCGVGGDRDGDD
jgi:hypothetical protein